MTARDETSEKVATWQPCRSLTDEQRSQFAEVELHENELERAERMDHLRNWLLESDELNARIDDFFILRFLRGCKFDVEKAKHKLNNYYVQRSLSPDWFTKRNPFLPEVQELLDLGVFLPLKRLDEQGRLIVIVRPCVHDPKKHKQADVCKVSMMLLDLATRDEIGASLQGVIAVHDMTGVRLAHGLQMTPGIVKRLVNLWQSYPNRLCSIDYVNAPFHVSIVLNIFKTFMSKKLRQRVEVHPNGSSLLSKISPGLLPAELGGIQEDYESLKNYWKQQAEDNKQWYVEDEKYKLINCKF